MPSTETQTINQYCSVCKDQFDMEVVKQGSSKGVIWLKCPGCQGFLPYTGVEQLPKQITFSPQSEYVQFKIGYRGYEQQHYKFAYLNTSVRCSI